MVDGNDERLCELGNLLQSTHTTGLVFSKIKNAGEKQTNEQNKAVGCCLMVFLSFVQSISFNIKHITPMTTHKYLFACIAILPNFCMGTNLPSA